MTPGCRREPLAPLMPPTTTTTPRTVGAPCLDGGGDPPPIQRRCCCRGDGGLAHVACMVQLAAHTDEQDDGWGGWSCCGTCKQLFTGRMQQGLAQAWWSRVASNDVDDPDRLAAAGSLAGSCRALGRCEEAETLQAEVLAVEKWVGGEDAPNTRFAAANLALMYMDQAKCAKAAELQTKVLTMVKRAKGAEHPDGPARHRQPCCHT